MANTAWLIERHIGNTLNYWSPGAVGRGGLNDWSHDIKFAVRFCREQDAMMALYHVCGNQGRVAEHVWVGRP